MRYLALLALLLTSCTTTVIRRILPEVKEDTRVTVQELQARTVLVKRRCSDGKSATGTGVVLEAYYFSAATIATAAHVVKSLKDCKVQVQTPDGNWHLVFRGKVDKKHDVALLYTLSGWDSPKVEFSRAALGEPIVTFGYPYDLNKKRPLPSLSRGEVITVYDGWEDSKAAYRLNAPIMPGSSGGGAWTVDGRLIGLTVSIWTNGLGLPLWGHTYVSASEHLANLL